MLKLWGVRAPCVVVMLESGALRKSGTPAAMHEASDPIGGDARSVTRLALVENFDKGCMLGVDGRRSEK